MLVHGGQREALVTSAGAELPLEIRGPQVVGGAGGGGYDARVLMGAPPSCWRCEALAGQQDTGRPDGRAGLRGAGGVPEDQPGQQLAGPPVGMVSLRRTQQRGQLCVRLVRTRVRSMAAVHQHRQPRGRVPGQPLVSGLPAHATARATPRASTDRAARQR